MVNLDGDFWRAGQRSLPMIESRLAFLSSIGRQSWIRVRERYIWTERPLTSQRSLDVARAFQDALDAFDVHYWISGGTLLGLVRDGSLIPWDDDLDFDCHAPSLYTRGAFLEADLVKRGFLVQWKGGRVFTSLNAVKDGVKCTVSGFRVMGKRLQRPAMWYPARHMAGATASLTVRGHNISWRLPSDPEGLLQFMYLDWRKPIRSDDSSDYQSPTYLTRSVTRIALRSLDRGLPWRATPH